MKSITIRLLLFFYLSSTYLSATHIHHDALKSLDDCKVHLIVKNLNSADTPHNSFELISCINCFEEIYFNTHQFVQPITKGFDAQAPPHFS
jgi:hypothetical protein